MKKKAIIFDVDGTAMPIGDENWPTERLTSVIKKLQKEFCVSVATGRSLMYIEDIIDFLGLKDECVIAAGTEIYSPITKSISWSEKIPSSLHEHILRELKDCAGRVNTGDMHGSRVRAYDLAKLLHSNTSVIYVTELEVAEADRICRGLLHPELHILPMHSYWGGTSSRCAHNVYKCI
jgi:hydroxymethylpyrimidine pyrophosphatase-like HAD family hydrolase